MTTPWLDLLRLLYSVKDESLQDRLYVAVMAERERAYREGLKDGYRDAQPRSDAA